MTTASRRSPRRSRASAASAARATRRSACGAASPCACARAACTRTRTTRACSTATRRVRPAARRAHDQRHEALPQLETFAAIDRERRARAVGARRAADPRLERGLLVGRGAVLARRCSCTATPIGAAASASTRVEVLGTDIDRASLAAAERGTYRRGRRSPTRRPSCGEMYFSRQPPFTHSSATCARACSSERRDLLREPLPRAAAPDRLPQRPRSTSIARRRSGCSSASTTRCARRISRARQGGDAARPRAHEVRAGRRAASASSGRYDDAPEIRVQGRRLRRRPGRRASLVHDRPGLVRRDRAVRSRGARRRARAHAAAERGDVARPRRIRRSSRRPPCRSCSRRCARSARATARIVREDRRRREHVRAARSRGRHQHRRAQRHRRRATCSRAHGIPHRRPRTSAATTAAASISARRRRARRSAVAEEGLSCPLDRAAVACSSSTTARSCAAHHADHRRLRRVPRRRHGAQRARCAAEGARARSATSSRSTSRCRSSTGSGARLHHERDAAPGGDAQRAARRAAGDELTLRALELGAVDFVRKPSGPISLDLATIRDELLGALRAAAQVNLAGVRCSALALVAPRRARSPRAPSAARVRRRDRGVHRRAARARRGRSRAARAARTRRCSSCSTCRPASRDARRAARCA